MSAFEVLNKVNVNGHTEKKNGLTYLSWAWAWAEVKKVYPDAHYEIEKFAGLPYAYDPLTGYMVYTTVTIEGLTHEMWLPVMDGANRAMKSEAYEYKVKNPYFKWAKLADDGKYYDKYGNEQPEYLEKVCEAATMFDINKTIMRCLVKNLAMFGLGLYIYAGEDLPEEELAEAKEEVEEVKADRVTPIMVTAMLERMARIGEKGINVEKVCEHYGVKELGELNIEQYTKLNMQLNKEEERLKKAMRS